MTEKEYFAHISIDGKKQTVLDHLCGTALLCAKFADSFGASKQGEYIGTMHDIGKYSDAFQKRFHGGAKVDHSTAGAYEAALDLNIPAAFCIAGHHAGLPDGGSQTDLSGTTLSARLNNASKGTLPDYAYWKRQLRSPDFGTLPSFSDGAQAAFYIRMLYSCLVDADFIDTESFMSGMVRETTSFDVDTLLASLDRYTKPWFPPQSELNLKRCQILNSCIKQCCEPRGLFSLTVPTGGGKTIASLAFALNHAKAHKMKRIIYVIPYTSIIEQTASIFKSILGTENVLEHHSVAWQTLDNDEFDLNMAKATENWDAPVVVTTAVQFFESLYSAKSSKCRKLHNIANSVIIFDEAQMLPVPYLQPCVFAISELVRQYGVSAVLCTATQPALNDLFREFIPSCDIHELCPNELFVDNIFRRVRFEKAGVLSCKDVADRMNHLSQILTITNSRKSAQEIFDNLHPGNRYHLSTLMYPAHRKAVLKEIREKLRHGEECRVVATSLIEAGVDVDFPKVYREEAGLDSIIQAAGRCNREGKRPADDSVVTVFRNDKSAPAIFDIPIKAGRTSMNEYDDPSCKEAIDMYFRELLSLKGDAALDRKKIISQFRCENFPFKTVSEQFKLIESDTRTVYIPIGEGKNYIERLRSGEKSRKFYQTLAQYGVSVYENHFKALESAGAVRIFDDGSIILTDLSLYSDDTGLQIHSDSGQALFI